MERHLSRQTVAILLYSRRFQRVSGPALDVLVTLLGELLEAICRQAARCSELVGKGPRVSFSAVLPGVLRGSRFLYISMKELLEYAGELSKQQADPSGAGSSIWEARQVPILRLPARVLPPLLRITKDDDSSKEQDESDTPPSSIAQKDKRSVK